jgi:hypothetical protein
LDRLTPVKVGDQVSVDLSGIYLAICSACGSAGLAVPGGRCVRCSAPEGALIADPRLLDRADVRGRDDHGVLPTERHIELDRDESLGGVDADDDTGGPDASPDLDAGSL